MSLRDAARSRRDKPNKTDRSVRYWQSGGRVAGEEAPASGGHHLLSSRLSSKIRAQAGQLADLTERLQQQDAYSTLVEARLLELDPSHDLPVTPCHLGCGVSGELGQPSNRSKGVGVRGRNDAGTRCSREQIVADGDMRRGYQAAQERLKDAAQLIRQLREALATRDADAKAAADRARKFQREADDLRRKVELHTNRPDGAACSWRADGKAFPGGGEGSDLLGREVSRLKKELQGQREACATAKAEESRLRAALEVRSQELGEGKGGAAITADLANARSTIDSLRAEVARLRLKPQTSGVAAGCNSLQSRGNRTYPVGAMGGNRKSAEGTMFGTPRWGGVEDLLAEKEALLDYVQDLLAQIKDLEASCASLERERVETSRVLNSLKEELNGPDTNAVLARRASQQKEQELLEVREELTALRQAGQAELSEKKEMERLYDELLKQLGTAEEEKGNLQAKARQATKREETESDAARALREQLDQCLQRLSAAEDRAAERVRNVEEESLAVKNALSAATARLAKIDALEAEVVAQTQELDMCRRESDALNNAFLNSNSRLEKLAAVEVEVVAAREELKKHQDERRLCEETLANERARTQHLVEALRDAETEVAVGKSRESAAISRAENLGDEVHQKEAKVEQLAFLCEELQKRVSALQSGEEMERVQCQVVEAFDLAERQDELLEDASARLEQLKEESRNVEKELRRAEESYREACNVLAPAVAMARSRLRENIAEEERSTSKPSHLWDMGEQVENRVDCWGRRGELRHEGEGGEMEMEASLESLAQEAADLLVQLFAEIGGGNADATTENRRAVAETVGRLFALIRRQSQTSADSGPLEASHLTTTCSIAQGESNTPHHMATTRGYGTDTCGRPHGGMAMATGRFSSASASCGERDHASHAPPSRPKLKTASGDFGTDQSCWITAGCVGRDGTARMASCDEEGVSRPCGIGISSTSGNAKPLAGDNGVWVNKSPRVGLGSRGNGGEESKSKSVAWADSSRNQRAIRTTSSGGAKHGGSGRPSALMTEYNSVQRMEAIRRGGSGDTLSAGGVKSSRRGHLQQGRSRPGTTAKNISWTPFVSGVESPSTAKIRQRVREAQTTLRSLRSAAA